MSFHKALYLRTESRQSTNIVFFTPFCKYLSSYIHTTNPSKVVYITDDILFSKLSISGLSLRRNIFVLKHGEIEKNIHNFKKILSFFYNTQVDKKSLIVAIGGGMVTDLSGFAASVYYRGIPIVYVPTTLLAQVDAAIGGKNTINFSHSKNIVGTVYLPKVILIDSSLLESLPPREFSSGMAELIKYGIGFDKRFLNELEAMDDKHVQLRQLIYRSINIKIKLVAQDLYEKGNKRKLLNLGHTLGQALESEHDYFLTHGEAVSIGLVFSSFISRARGYISEVEFNRILAILRKYNLPPKVHFTSKMAPQNMKYDKKSNGSSIDFILLKKLGKSFVCKLSFDNLQLYLNKFQPLYRSI